MKLHIRLRTISFLIFTHNTHVYVQWMSYSVMWLYLIKCVFACSIFADQSQKYFLESTLFLQKLSKIQKLCCPVLATQSLVEPVACPSRKSKIEIFRDSLATHWRVNVSIAKKTWNIVQNFGILCFSWLRLVTCSWVEGLVTRGT